ncbi:MAG: hypothetical protein FD174_2733 [Geobacteraceae bacterium]|nr:MAG: hypothetical protein FD174_2733 [Geobacteraceae bacterium]
METPVRRIEAMGDLAGLSRRGTELFVTAAVEAIGARGRFSVAVSGGSTPRPLFQLLATEEFRTRIDWERVHFFWADERCVPPDHPDSNFKGAHDILLAKLPLPAANIHRIPGELAPPEAARAYERELRVFFSGASMPVFDLILLGVGEDGHTASLFPGEEGIGEKERLAVALYVEKLHTHRVTLTLPVLNSARRVVFLVAGREKAVIVQEVLEGKNPRLPAAQVNPPEGSLIWLLDSEAAGKLSGNFCSYESTTSS